MCGIGFGIQTQSGIGFGVQEQYFEVIGSRAWLGCEASDPVEELSPLC